MKVLVDEAHGTHLYFGENLPVCAMDAGADMASVSMHKSGGSLTQSSILLTGKNVNWEYVSPVSYTHLDVYKRQYMPTAMNNQSKQ